MSWHLVLTKPRMELVALENLENQGYKCYLPMMNEEKVIQKQVKTIKTPLFPRYLFVKLGKDFFAKSWGPVRSTRGVSCLVKFGIEPAKINDQLIEILKTKERQYSSNVKSLFERGQTLKILNGPFKDFESIYQGMNGEMRVIVLLEFMKKHIAIALDLEEVKLMG